MASYNFESEYQRQSKGVELHSKALDARAAAEAAEQEYVNFQRYSRVIGGEALGFAMYDIDSVDGDLIPIDPMDLLANDQL